MKKLIILFVSLLMARLILAESLPFEFHHLSTQEGLPNNMIHYVEQDNHGFLWFGTFYGMYSYDGFSFRPVKSDISNPTLLPSNNVICLAIDRQKDLLWVGTQEGLCSLNLKNNHRHNYPLNGSNGKRINGLTLSSSGQLFATTQSGLAIYDAEKDSLILVNKTDFKGDVPAGIDTQMSCELRDGTLMIATWRHGLYRLNIKEKRFVHYPEVNGENSFLSLFQDSTGRIWLGSRNHGLIKISFSSDRESLIATTYQHIESEVTSLYNNCVYSINEHPETHTLWVGTRDGFSVMRLSEEGVFINYNNKSSVNYTPIKEVENIFRDQRGMIWIASKGDGLLLADDRNAMVSNLFADGKSQRVQSILVDGDESWIGYGYGVEFHSQGKTISLLEDKRTYHIDKSPTSGNIFLSVHGGGMCECSHGRILHQYLKDNCHFLSDDAVTDWSEDGNGTWWVTTLHGLGARYKDGREVCFSDLKGVPTPLSSMLIAMKLDKDGSLWVASQTQGIIHLTGDMLQPEEIRYKVYSRENGNLPINSLMTIFQDRSGRIWAGSEGCGLCLYDAERDRFESVHSAYNLPGDMVMSIEEDEYGNLWLGTNKGLTRLSINSKNGAEVHTFTVDEGMPDNFFEQNSSCQQDGVFYFGSGQGVVAFRPTTYQTGYARHQVAITGLWVDGRSLEDMKDEERGQYSDLSTGYTERFIIPADVHSFTIAFASLTYNEPYQSLYAYRLNGYDKDWVYTHSDNRQATYTNLSPGTYQFEVKATDENSNWSDPYSFAVVVKPPFYRTWAAYIVYVLMILALIAYSVQRIRSKMMLQNKLALQLDDEMNITIDHTQLEPSRSIMQLEIKNLNYTSADEEFLRKSIACVKQHLDDATFDNARFVEEMATSRTTLFKKLKEMTGLNPSRFIRDIRMKAACQIIKENPDIRISELAYAVGYNDPKYFSSCFKETFGMTPSEYVEKGEE